MASSAFATHGLSVTALAPRPNPSIRPEIDPTIVRRCQAGDREAFRSLVVHYQRPVFSFLYRTLGGENEVEDIAQEVFLRAFCAISRFDPQGPARLSTWLFTIAWHLVQDMRRKNPRRRALELHLSDGPTATLRTPESDQHDSEIGHAVAKAAAVLPDEQRDVFLLAEYQQLSISEMAVVLGVGENTIKTRLFRARERLRVLLEPVWQEMTS